MEEKDESNRRWREHGGMECYQSSYRVSSDQKARNVQSHLEWRKIYINAWKAKKRKSRFHLWKKMTSKVHMWFNRLMMLTLAGTPSSVLNQKAYFMFWMSSFILKLHQIHWSSTKGSVCLMYSSRLHAAFVRSWMEADSSLTELLDLQWSATAAMMGHNRTHWPKTDTDS